VNEADDEQGAGNIEGQARIGNLPSRLAARPLGQHCDLPHEENAKRNG
jgi:hypothetical protein